MDGFNNKYPYTDFHELNLDWFLERFKTVMDEWDEMQVKFKTVEDTVAEFTAFVTNYFNNLDVQEEINNKLDALVADGTIQSMIEPMFDEMVQNVTNMVSDQNARITTLEGRMDAFASLTEGSTTGDAELMDIRVEYDGTIAASAGDAVREQVDGIYDILNPIHEHVNYFDGKEVEGTTATGITITDLGDGSIMLNGTSTNQSNLPAVTFIPFIFLGF